MSFENRQHKLLFLLPPVAVAASLVLSACATEHETQGGDDHALAASPSACDGSPVEEAADADVAQTAQPANTPGSDLPPSGATIVSVTASGSGCPGGKPNVTFSPEQTNFFATFAQFTAALAATSASNSDSKACVLNINAKAPEGYVYAVQSFSMTAAGSMDEDMRTRISSMTSFVGGDVSGPVLRTIDGPWSGTKVFDFELEDDQLMFGPCGSQRNAELIVTLGLRNSTPPRAGKIDITQVGPIKLALRRCP